MVLEILKSVWDCNDFRRFRIGISNDKSINTVSYVLGKFSKDDMSLISSFLPKACDILSDFCRMDFDKLMSMYNKG